MKRMLALLLTLCTLFTLSACASKSADRAPAAVEAPAAEPQMMADMEFTGYDAAEYGVVEESAANMSGGAYTQSAPASAALDADTRKIVYNADLQMTADNPAAALDAVIERATQLGGYVSDSYTTNDELGAWRSSATIKVPAESLSELIAAAKALGKVDDYQLSSDDITMHYYDVAARLGSAKAEETQLLEILGKCETVEDILAVRESLARVRSDIESYQGRINLWDNLVSYATLTLSINRTPQPEVAREKELLTIWKASDVWKRMSRGFVNSARFVVNAVSAIGIFLAVIAIPAALLFVVVGLPVIFARKRRSARAASSGEPLPPTRAEKKREKKQSTRENKLPQREEASAKPEPADEASGKTEA